LPLCDDVTAEAAVGGCGKLHRLGCACSTRFDVLKSTRSSSRFGCVAFAGNRLGGFR
jgi:hypothetical protein